MRRLFCLYRGGCKLSRGCKKRVSRLEASSTVIGFTFLCLSPLVPGGGTSGLINHHASHRDECCISGVIMTGNDGDEYHVDALDDDDDDDDEK